MQSNTSSEFVDWMYFAELELVEKTKQDYYLAQIAAEIRQVRQMFADHPKQIALKDCFIPFELEDEGTPPPVIPDKSVIPDTLEEAGEGWVETGPELVKDPKWAKINAEAKAMWAAFTGMTPSPPGEHNQ